MGIPKITTPVIEVAGRLWMTTMEAGRRYGVSRPTIYRWMKDGLPSRKIGRVRRINVSQMAEWYRNQTTSVLQEPSNAEVAEAQSIIQNTDEQERGASAPRV